MKNSIGSLIGCIILWSVWPILAKLSKMPPSVITTTVTISTMFTALIWLRINKEPLSTSTTIIGLMILIVAGTLNGVGMILYGSLVSDSKNVSLYVAIISAGVGVITVLISGIIFIFNKNIGEELTAKKLGLVVIIGICTYLLLKKK